MIAGFERRDPTWSQGETLFELNGLNPSALSGLLQPACHLAAGFTRH